MKVQTCSKYEPKFPKEMTQICFKFLVKRCKNLVLISSKSEPENKGGAAQNKVKIELRREKAMMRKF